jgi:hypothetical protein
MWLILIALAAIITATASITWKVAHYEIELEKRKEIETQLLALVESNNHWAQVDKENKAKIVDAEKKQAALSQDLYNLKKGLRNEKRNIPANCVIDDIGVRYINEARSKAISAARGEPNGSVP